MVQENPIISIQILNDIEKRIGDNSASVKDYEDLSYFLTTFRMEYFIIDNLRKYGFYSYQDFINYRNKPRDQKTLFVEEGIIIGILQQCITLLKNSLLAKK